MYHVKYNRRTINQPISPFIHSIYLAFLMSDLHDMGIAEESSAGGQEPEEESWELLGGLNQDQTLSLLLNSGGRGRPIVYKFPGRRLALNSLFNTTVEDLQTTAQY